MRLFAPNVAKIRAIASVTMKMSQRRMTMKAIGRLRDELLEVTCHTAEGVIHPFQLRPGEIEIHSMARTLSNRPRYGGACEFYSVAQHCTDGTRFLLKEGVDTLTALTFLLHDGGEAFPPYDWPAPVLRWYPSVQRLATKQQAAVYQFFLGAQPDARTRAMVHAMDMQMRAMEIRRLFKDWRTWGMSDLIPPVGWENWMGPIRPSRSGTHHEIAAAMYVNLFDQLMTEWEGERYARN
jgi:hypothetical protein